ncbi:MAG: YceI family protein [Deltaproteobacteria bacterium]|jgi:YceI-like domain|nr:MAG: YceI family protein [Deltaproteobacteria bacterium]
MLALVAVLLCAPPAGQLLDLRKGTLTYTVVHRLHEVRATSHQVEGRALAQPDGTVKVQVRVRVATFDSGNSNRDEHMREVTHEHSHPYAEVKGTISGVTVPLQQSQETTLHGTVELNGEKRAQDVAVKLEPAGGGVRASFAFPLSLEAFKVERPQLLLIKIDDRAVISGDLRFETAR